MRQCLYNRLLALCGSCHQPAAFTNRSPTACFFIEGGGATRVGSSSMKTRASSRSSRTTSSTLSNTSSTPRTIVRVAAGKKEEEEPAMASATKKRKSPQTPATTISNNKKKATTTTTTIATTTTQPWYTSFTKGDPQYDAYMSSEWGFSQKEGDAVDDVDAVHFETLSLEGAQSGLSWLTILRKREAYRRTFHNFDPVRVARMTAQDVQGILLQEGPPTTIVVRHRGKIESVVNNANCVLQLREEKGAAAVGSFTKHLWSFVDHQPILNCSIHRTAPSKSPESEAMSKDLKKRGFRFVGPTTCYAMMQAMGLVIDHPVDTPEWRAAKERLQARKGGYQERR